MGKHADIVRLLQHRIRHGDYRLKPLPPEMKLAEDFSVSRFTVRKALGYLIDGGVLARLPNGRVTVNRGKEGGSANLHLAFLQPSHPSFEAEWYRLAAERAAAAQGATLRPILYLHWHDTLIQEALADFDAVFFMPLPEAIPPWLVDLFKSAPAGRVVVLDQDLSPHGVQSIRLFPASFVQKLLDHLAELGHRRIDCFNVHPLEPAVRARIEQWQVWRSAHGVEGREHDESGKHMGWLSDQAYMAMDRLLRAGQFEATALLCTAMPAAIGVLRAMRDHGVEVGRDVSVCTVNDDGVARYLSPSVTALVLPDAAPYIATCIRRVRDGAEGWTCPLLLQLDHAPLFIGESTGPAPERPNAGERLSACRSS